MPKRVQPQLSANIEKGAASLDNTNKTPDLKHFEHSACPRHGRKLKSIRDASVSAAGLEKGFGGSYVPTGHKVRYQVDAISPWAVAWKALTKSEGTIVSPEICPDCLAERDILEDELESRSGLDYAGLPLTVPTCSSTYTERGTPTSQAHPNVLVGSTHDNQTINVAGATVSGLSPDHFGHIISADLGNMIDAIIIEHSGTLDKVVTNLRNGMTGAEITRKVSSDLAKVSDAMARLPEGHVAKPTIVPFEAGVASKRSMVFDTSPEFLQERTKTVPEILDLIDSTAVQFGLRGTDQDDAKPLGQLTRGSTHDRLLSMPGNFPDPDPGTPFAPLQPTAGPQPSSSRPVTSLLATPALKSALRNVTLPTIESSTAASHKAPASLTTPVPTPAVVAQSTGTGTKSKASLPAVEASSRALPQPAKSSPDDPPSSRRTRIPKAVASPWAKNLLPTSPGSAGTHRAGVARPKPSDVAKQQKEQRTFQQAWLKEAASAERMYRRSRSGLKL